MNSLHCINSMYFNLYLFYKNDSVSDIEQWVIFFLMFDLHYWQK